jgi:hypothetical protein
MSPTARPPALLSPIGRAWPLFVAAIALSAVGCKKKPTPNPTVRDLSWHGLELGMPHKQIAERFRAQGWEWECTEASNVMFLEGDALYTLWVKQAARKRVQRCATRRPKGKKPGPERILRIGLYFLDGKLVRLNVLMALGDQQVMKRLKARMGTPRSLMLTRYAYASKKQARTNVWALSRRTTRMLWLRMQHRQELVFLTTDAKLVATMRAISTTRKDE